MKASSLDKKELNTGPF